VRITFLTWEYPPHVYGGAGVHVQSLVDNLKDRVRVEVRTILPQGSKEPEFVTEEKVVVHRFPAWPLLNSGDPSSSVLSALSTDLAFVRDPVESDIIHAHTWYTALAGYYAKQLYGPKLVMTVHSLEPRRPWKARALGSAYRLSTWAEKTGLEACDGIVAVSRADAADVTDCYDVNPDRIRVIPNGVDPVVFQRREDSETLKRYGVRKPYVLFLGRLSRQKGIFDLVSATSRLPGDVTVVLVTGAPDDPGLAAELSRSIEGGHSILWIDGMLPRKDVVALVSGASVFAAPSLYEPFGIMNLEAMACERPVVSTRVGGIPDVVVEGETGLLVQPGDAGKLAEAINSILSRPEWGERMGKEGRKRVLSQFTWPKVADETLSFYKDILG
jgi:glycogen synthase